MTSPLMGIWTWPVTEKLNFNTEIRSSHDRTEQRIAKRLGLPARYLSSKIVVDNEADLQRLEAIIHSGLKTTWYVPIWPLAELHEDNLASGGDTIAVDTQYACFEEGSYVLIWQKGNPEYDVLEIDTIAVDSITTADLIGHDYSGKKWIMPCHLGWCVSAVNAERYPRAGLYNMTFRIQTVYDVTGFTADMTYDGYTVLSEPARLFRDTGEFSFDPDFEMLDSGSGPFEIVSNSDYNIITQPHGWVCKNKQAAWWLRQFLFDIRGTQKSFLVPTFRDDLELTRPVGAAETSVYVAHRGLKDNMDLNDMRTYLAFRPAGADIIPRKITAITEISDAEELLTINTAPGSAFVPGDKLCWIDRCRLLSGEIDFSWSGRGKCTIDTTLLRVTN